MDTNVDEDVGEMIVKRVSVPIGLEELMEGLVKEVLLTKPDDIYIFAAKYFSQLLIHRDKNQHKAKTLRSAQSLKDQGEKRYSTKIPVQAGTAGTTGTKQLSRQFSMRGDSPNMSLDSPIVSQKPRMYNRNDQKYKRKNNGPQTIKENQSFAVRKQISRSVSNERSREVVSNNAKKEVKKSDSPRSLMRNKSEPRKNHLTALPLKLESKNELDDKNEETKTSKTKDSDQGNDSPKAILPKEEGVVKGREINESSIHPDVATEIDGKEKDSSVDVSEKSASEQNRNTSKDYKNETSHEITEQAMEVDSGEPSTCENSQMSKVEGNEKPETIDVGEESSKITIPPEPVEVVQKNKEKEVDESDSSRNNTQEKNETTDVSQNNLIFSSSNESGNIVKEEIMIEGVPKPTENEIEINTPREDSIKENIDLNISENDNSLDAPRIEGSKEDFIFSNPNQPDGSSKIKQEETKGTDQHKPEDEIDSIINDSSDSPIIEKKSNSNSLKQGIEEKDDSYNEDFKKKPEIPNSYQDDTSPNITQEEIEKTDIQKSKDEKKEMSTNESTTPSEHTLEDENNPNSLDKNSSKTEEITEDGISSTVDGPEKIKAISVKQKELSIDDEKPEIEMQRSDENKVELTAEELSKPKDSPNLSTTENFQVVKSGETNMMRYNENDKVNSHTHSTDVKEEVINKSHINHGESEVTQINHSEEDKQRLEDKGESSTDQSRSTVTNHREEAQKVNSHNEKLSKDHTSEPQTSSSPDVMMKNDTETDGPKENTLNNVSVRNIAIENNVMDNEADVKMEEEKTEVVDLLESKNIKECMSNSTGIDDDESPHSEVAEVGAVGIEKKDSVKPIEVTGNTKNNSVEENIDKKGNETDSKEILKGTEDVKNKENPLVQTPIMLKEISEGNIEAHGNDIKDTDKIGETIKCQTEKMDSVTEKNNMIEDGNGDNNTIATKEQEVVGSDILVPEASEGNKYTGGVSSEERKDIDVKITNGPKLNNIEAVGKENATVSKDASNEATKKQEIRQLNEGNTESENKEHSLNGNKNISLEKVLTNIAIADDYKINSSRNQENGPNNKVEDETRDMKPNDGVNSNDKMEVPNTKTNVSTDDTQCSDNSIKTDDSTESKNLSVDTEDKSLSNNEKISDASENRKVADEQPFVKKNVTSLGDERVSEHHEDTSDVTKKRNNIETATDEDEAHDNCLEKADEVVRSDINIEKNDTPGEIETNSMDEEKSNSSGRVERVAKNYVNYVIDKEKDAIPANSIDRDLGREKEDTNNTSSQSTESITKHTDSNPKAMETDAPNLLQKSSQIVDSPESSEVVSSFDKSKLREELQKVEEESKFTTFKPTFNPLQLRQEIENASLHKISPKEADLRHSLSEVAAVLKIQSLWRGFKVRRNIDKPEILRIKDENSNVLEKQSRAVNEVLDTLQAVIIIQRLWRGYKTRRDLKKMQARRRRSANRNDFPDATLAAVRIQKLWRGFKTRKLSKNQQNSSETIETVPKSTSKESSDSMNTVIFNDPTKTHQASMEESFGSETKEHSEMNSLLDEILDYPVIEEQHLIDAYQNRLLDKISGKNDDSIEDLEVYEALTSKKPEPEEDLGIMHSLLAKPHGVKTKLESLAEEPAEDKLYTFCSAPSPIPCDSKIVEGKPLDELVETVETKSNSANKILNHSVSETQPKVDSKSPVRTLSLDSVRLLHSGELHDTLVVPLPKKITESLKPGDKAGSAVPKTENGVANKLSNSGLLHTGELHDSIVLPFTIGKMRSSTVSTGKTDEVPRDSSAALPVVSVNIENNAVPVGVQVLQAPAELGSVTSPRVASAHAQSRCVTSTPPAIASETLAHSASRRPSMGSDEGEEKTTQRNTSMEAEAARKIQAGFRGYQVRKQLKLKNGSSDMSISNSRRQSRPKSFQKESPKSQSKPKDIEEKSAVKIQAGVRGFLVRRRQKKQINP